MTGEQDQDQEGFDRLEKLLSDRGLPVHREVHSLGHEFPPNFSDILARALAFLSQSIAGQS